MGPRRSQKRMEYNDVLALAENYLIDLEGYIVAIFPSQFNI
jgi:hypothetical protein